MKSWFAGTASSVNSEIITPFSNAEQIIYKYNQAIKHSSLTQQGWQRLIAQCDDGLASYLTNIKGSTASMSAYSVSLQGNITGYTKITQAMKQYNALGAVSQKEQQNFATAVSLTNTKLGSYLTGLNGAKASLSGYGVSLIASTAKTVGLTIATTALNTALTFGISAIITGVVSAFATWINSSKKITEAAEEAKDKIASINDDLKTNTETVKNVKQRYAELAQEVENFGQVSQSRGSLSTDEYEEFLDLSNQLAGVFPQLTKGYDDNGNAILDLSGNVDTIVSSLDDLLQKEKDLANQKIMDEFPDVYKGYVKDLGKAESEVKSAKSEFDKINNAYQQLQNGSVSQAFDLQGNGTFENADGEQVKVTLAEYEQALKDLGIEYEKTNIMVKNQFGGDTLSGYLINAVGDVDTAFTSKLETARKNLEYAEQQLEGEKSSIDSYLNTWLQSEFTYNQIDDSGLQTAVQDMIMNFDFSNLPDDIDKNDWNAVSEYLRRNILFAINDVQDNPEISKAISEVFTNQDLTPEEKADYLQQIKDYFDNLLGEDNAISISLQPQIEDTDALEQSYTNTINRFKSSEESSLEELKQSYQEAIDKRKELYSGTNYVGNVDINNRPVVINDDGSYSTTSTSFQEKWVGDEENGHYIIAHFTPILPDGTVLDGDSLNEYIDKILNSDDPMEADKIENGGKGIVYKVDTEINGKEIKDDNLEDAFGVADAWDVDMHNLQDKMYRDEAKIKGQIAQFDNDVDGSQKIKDFFDTEGINTDEEINEFNEVTKGINDADLAIQKWNEHKKEANETPISFVDAWQSLKDTDDSSLKGQADELTKLAEAGRLTVDALKGLDGGKTLMEQTGLSAEKLAEGINNLTDASTQLNSLSGQISKMSDMLADKKNGKATDAKDLAGFDAEVRGLDSWKEFEKVMGSSKSTMAECQKAANALATEWVNSGNYLENLTEENKNYYITQLQSMGVENAEAVITASLAQKKYNLALEQDYLNLMKANGIAATNDLANVTATEIQRLLDEGKITSDTASKMAELVIKKRMANGNTISTAADIKNLADLAGASTKLGKLLNNLARIKQGFTNGMPSDIAEKQAETYQKQIEALVGGGNSVNVDTGINIKDTGSSNHKQTGGSSSGSSSNNSKTKIDWIERRLTALQNKIDITQSKFENLFSVKSKSNNLQKQISLINKLLNTTNKSADRYKKAANSVKLSSSLKKKVREGSYNITEYDSKTANAINEYKDLYDKYKNLEKQATELTKTILGKKIEKNQLYIDRADANREKSESIIANKRVDNATSLNKSLKYQKEQIKTSYNYQIKNAKLENDSVKVQKLKADKQRELTELNKQEFDNIQNAYEYRQKSNLAQKEALSDALSLAEARGDVIGKAYYTGQKKATKADLKSKQNELTALDKSLKNIKQGTSEWYDAMDAIYAVRSAIRQDEIELVNLQNKLDQVNFDRFDEFINKIEDVSNELNFLKGVLSDELFDGKGGITADGMTAIGLTLMNGDIAASKRDYYKQQLEQLEKDYNNGNGTIGYNTYIEKQREYNQAIQDSVTAMVDAKKAAVNYVKQGLDAQNDALQKAVDKQKELIEEQQELQKWNDKIADQNKSINRMQRRLDILSQDDSQENQKTIRELRDKLETARKEQKNDFYDKSVDDQKNSLDQMVKDAKEKSENYLKDSEKVFADATAYINANSTQVASNLKHISKELGYDISTYITDAWKDGGNAITGYSNTLTRNIGGITAQIGLIKSAWDEVCKSADKAAKAIVNANSANNDNSSNSGSNNTVTNNTVTNNTVTNKEIKKFINDSLNKATHGESYYGALNKYLYRKTGKVLSKKEEVQLAKMLGVSVKDDLSGSGDRQKILDALLKRKIAFANGGVLGDLVRLTGEDGLFIGSRGESVLTQEQTKALINFAPVIPQLSSMLNTIKNLPVNSNMVQYPVYNIDNKTIVEGVATNEIVKNMESVAKQQAETVIKKINNSAYSKGVRR